MVRINLYTIKQVKESGGNYNLPNKKIRSPQDAHRMISAVLDLSNDASEKFGILSLNTKNEVTGIHVLSMGSLNVSIVHPREVFKAAILNNAASIVCFHNHPSGDPTPSAEDVEINQRLVESGELLGINVLDHIIVGDNRHFSMKDKGLM